MVLDHGHGLVPDQAVPGTVDLNDDVVGDKCRRRTPGRCRGRIRRVGTYIKLEFYRPAANSDDPLELIFTQEPLPVEAGRAQTDAPCQSMPTTVSSPTTHASWPGGNVVISPAVTSSSVPSAMTTCRSPHTWYD